MMRLARLKVWLGQCRVQGALALALTLAACAGQSGPDSNILDEISHIDLKPRQVASNTPNGAATTGATAGATQPGSQVVFDNAAPQAGTAPATTTTVTSRPDGRYEVNLQDAPIVDAAKSLFTDVLQQPYSIDPRAQGTITLSTGGPVGRKELLTIFDAALAMNDLALIWDGTQYRITTAAVIQEGSPSGGFSANGGPAEAGLGITALPLRHVKAESLLPVLEGFAARGGMLRSVGQGNILVIRGTAAERNDLVQIASSFDSDALAKGSFGMGFLRNAPADQVVEELRRMQRDIDPDGTLRFEAVSRANGILVMARDRAQLQTGLDWVRRFDELDADGSGVHVYHVEFGNPTEIASMLARTFGSSGAASATPAGTPDDSFDNAGGTSPVSVQPDGKLAMPKPPTPMSNMQGQDGTSPQGGDGFGAETGAAPAGGEGEIRFTPSDNDNTIVIRAPGWIYRQALALLQSIDKPPTQVLINVVLAEVTLNDKLNYGVQTYLESSDLSFVSAPALPITSQIPGSNLIIGSTEDPTAILSALKRVTNVKVVSSPSVVALDNELAVIKVGEQVPITTQQVVDTTSATAPIVSSIEYRDAGVILKVHPRVSSSDLVTLKINQELSAVVGQTDGTTTLTPTLKQRSITSTISVYDRQTVVLGGLISNQQTKDRQGLPLVDKLPFIGNLMGQNANNTARTELVVFITPKVMRDNRDASDVSEELRSKLRILAE